MKKHKPKFKQDKRTTREAHEGRSMVNRKPYRTAALKKLAGETAVKIDGAFVSKAPVRFHPEARR